jgi:superfamily II DNA/RNA helicase
VARHTWVRTDRRHVGADASSIICSGGRSSFQQIDMLTLDEADGMLDMALPQPGI